MKIRLNCNVDVAKLSTFAALKANNLKVQNILDI